MKVWNDAGELLVEMNRANCPPDQSTIKEVLKAILACPSKYDGGKIEGESKFCAMMDLLEEMEHRNRGVKADDECWNFVMQAAIEEGDFRVGRALAACVPTVSPALIEANEKVAQAAIAAGNEFPAALTKQAENLFDIEIKAN